MKDSYCDKTVLVTGDTGFKGSWLCLWLLHLGARVIGVALPPKTGKDNYVVSGLEKKITHINGDIRAMETLLDIFAQHKPDIAFHLAAQPLVLESYRDPLTTFSTNIMGAVHFFEAVRNCPSVRVAINITSDKCYENREQKKGYREEDPLGGSDPYSASKACSEMVTSAYRNSFFDGDQHAHIASVRAGNVIGGGDWAENRIFPDCIRSLLSKKPIVMRNPKAIRPWQHVLEPLNGYLILGERLLKEGKKYSGAWNFGPSAKNRVSVRQLVEETIRQWGKGDFQIERNARGKPEKTSLLLNCSKSLHQLGWKPVLSFQDMVRLAIEEYRRGNTGSPEEVFQQRIEHIDQYENMLRLMRQKNL